MSVLIRDRNVITNLPRHMQGCFLRREAKLSPSLLQVSSLYHKGLSTTNAPIKVKGVVNQSPHAKLETAGRDIRKSYIINLPPWPNHKTLAILALISGVALLAAVYLPPKFPAKNKPGKVIGFDHAALTTHFAGREKELGAIKNELSKNGIVHLQGQGGAGKTQLALMYKNLNQWVYNRFIFIDCETEHELDSHLKLLVSAFGQPTENLVDEAKKILATDKNYLLIFDNIDDSTLAGKVKGLLDGKLSGHVIINGRCNIEPDRKQVETIHVGQVSPDDGLKIFSNCLSKEKYRELFNQLPREDKEKLIINNLGGLPFMIKVAANLLENTIWKGSDSRKDLVRLSEILSDFNPASLVSVEHALMKDIDYRNTAGSGKGGLDKIYAMSLASAENITPALIRPMVSDVLYFYGFYGKLQKIPFPKKSDRSVLKDVFIKSSTHPNLYEKLSDELFYDHFAIVTSNLKQVGLIDHEEEKGAKTDSVVTVSLPLKWAVQNDFLRKIFDLKEKAIDSELADYKAKCKAAWIPSSLATVFGYPDFAAYQKVKEYEKEKAKYAWLAAIISYFDRTVPGYELDSKQVPLILGLFGLIKNFQVSERWKSEILNTSRLWSLTKKALLQQKDPIKELSFKETYGLFKSILNKEIQLNPQEYERLVTVLLDHCQYYNDSDAESLLRLLQQTGHKKAFFLLGSLLYARAVKGKSRGERSYLLSEALNAFTQFLENNPSAEGYYRRALCYPDHKEGWEKSIADLREATKLTPYDAAPRKQLALYLSKTKQVERASIEKSIGEGLATLQEAVKERGKPISEKYGLTILKFLSNENGTFEIHESSWNRYIGDDNGLIFVKMLPYNSRTKTLILRGCDLTNEAFVSISGALKGNSTITCLKLEWNNKVTGEGVKALAMALAKNRTLQELSLSESYCIPADQVIDLIKQAPSQLKKISLINCQHAKRQEKAIKELAGKKGIEVLL